MAASSICNFLSFLLPSQPSPSKKLPTQFVSSSNSSPSSVNVPNISSSTSSQSRRNRGGVVPMLQNEGSISEDVLSVVCPSLVHANVLFFRSGYNVQVIVDENEHEEKLVGRFRREVMRAGVIQECKRRRFFENKQDEAKRKTREAAKRNRRRRPFSRTPQTAKQEVSKSKDDDGEDNWELPEGGLPY